MYSMAQRSAVVGFGSFTLYTYPLSLLRSVLSQQLLAYCYWESGPFRRVNRLIAEGCSHDSENVHDSR